MRQDLVRVSPLFDRANAVVTVKLINGRDVDVFVHDGIDGQGYDEAVKYVVRSKCEGFECAACGKFVPVLPKSGYCKAFTAFLLASQLCIDCHYWLVKVGNPYFKIVNGRSYALIDSHEDVTFDELQKMKRNGKNILILRSLTRVSPKGRPLYQVFNDQRIWKQGVISDVCRLYLTDTHEWVCPACFATFHNHGSDDMIGGICRQCQSSPGKVDPLKSDLYAASLFDVQATAA